jgi:uncharacterized protein YndB with AHSA1/START domain
MATSLITPDNDVVVAEILIAAPPARVFEAIAKQTAQWWGHKGRYRLLESHSDVRRGGRWLSRGVGADGVEFKVEGEYLEVDAPRLLVHTWNPSYTNLSETVVRWELESREVHGLHHDSPQRVGTGTLVRIRHSGFAGNVEQATRHGEGWKLILSWAQGFVERGETVETRN